MKFLRLELENFTSFTRLDLRFAPSGVMAITGPTGVGKSSILDAITLALFGRIARYGGRNPLTEAPFMRTGAPFCRVQLRLLAAGRELIAVFEQRRAGKSGRLQPPVRAICEAATGRVLASGKRACEAYFTELCGLDFAGFTSTVIIPQNQFVNFLKTSERTALLTLLADLKIYALIGQRAHENAREISAKIDALSAQCQAFASDEQLAAAARQLARAKAKMRREKLLAKRLETAVLRAELAAKQRAAAIAALAGLAQAGKKAANVSAAAVCEHERALAAQQAQAVAKRSLQSALNAAIRAIEGVFASNFEPRRLARAQEALEGFDASALPAEFVEQSAVAQGFAALLAAAEGENARAEEAERAALAAAADAAAEAAGAAGQGLAALKEAAIRRALAAARLSALEAAQSAAASAIEEAKQARNLAAAAQLVREHHQRSGGPCPVCGSECGGAGGLRGDLTGDSDGALSTPDDGEIGGRPEELAPAGQVLAQRCTVADSAAAKSATDSVADSVANVDSTADKSATDNVAMPDNLAAANPDSVDKSAANPGAVDKSTKSAKSPEARYLQILSLIARAKARQSAALPAFAPLLASAERAAEGLAQTAQQKSAKVYLAGLSEDFAQAAEQLNSRALAAQNFKLSLACKEFKTLMRDAAQSAAAQRLASFFGRDLASFASPAEFGRFFSAKKRLIAARTERINRAKSAGASAVESFLRSEFNAGEYAQIFSAKKLLNESDYQFAKKALEGLKTAIAHFLAQNFQPGLFTAPKTPLNRAKSRLARLAGRTHAIAYGAAQAEFTAIEKSAKASQKLREKIAKITEQNAAKLELAALIGDSTGKKFNAAALALALRMLIGAANEFLAQIFPRYELALSAANGGAIEVIDHSAQRARRSAASLSGGETFVISLALALGASSLAHRRFSLRTRFIDEGFGALDVASLETALGALIALSARQPGSVFGLISHVGQLAERADYAITLAPSDTGSKLV